MFPISMFTDENIAVWAHFLQNIRKSSEKVSVEAHIHKEHDRDTYFKQDGIASQKKRILLKYFPELCLRGNLMIELMICRLHFQ